MPLFDHLTGWSLFFLGFPDFALLISSLFLSGPSYSSLLLSRLLLPAVSFFLFFNSHPFFFLFLFSLQVAWDVRRHEVAAVNGLGAARGDGAGKVASGSSMTFNGGTGLLDDLFG
jgi:hypothetical protein